MRASKRECFVGRYSEVTDSVAGETTFDVEHSTDKVGIAGDCTRIDRTVGSGNNEASTASTASAEKKSHLNTTDDATVWRVCSDINVLSIAQSQRSVRGKVIKTIPERGRLEKRCVD